LRISANQEIRLIIWRLKIHYLARNSPPLVVVWNHTDAVFAHSLYFLDTQFNIVISLILSVASSPFLLGFFVEYDEQI